MAKTFRKYLNSINLMEKELLKLSIKTKIPIDDLKRRARFTGNSVLEVNLD